jgi:hypothetical protein
VSLLLIPLSIYPKKRFGCSEKREKREEEEERERENKGKRTNVPTYRGF